MADTVKSSYKIPTSLDENYMDMQIAIQSRDGVGLKPLPVRFIIAWVGSLLVLVYMLMKNGTMSTAGFGTKLLFGITWLGFTFVLTTIDKSHRMQVELIPALLKYLQKSNRHVITRRGENAVPFYSIVGIENIDPKTGIVKYTDGTWGMWFSVVGTASVLLFPSDRDMILERAEAFYRKLTTDGEIIFMTTKEPQRIAFQRAHLISQYQHRSFNSEGIKALVKEQNDALVNYVGKEFKSLHQYIIVKGDNKEALNSLVTIVTAEAINSQMLFRSLTKMEKEDIESVLALVYAYNT